MNIQVVIFDFDGTIADTGKTIVAAKQETMRRLGLEVMNEEICTSTIGYSAKKGFQLTYPELPEETIDLCVSTYRALFNEVKETTPPTIFPNVERVLAAIREKNIMRTIATSRNIASLKEFLLKWGIADYFPYVLGGEDTVHLKPHPEPVLKTLGELSFQAEQALVVGDMPMDILMGKDAGAHTCGVTYGNSKRKDLAEAGADYIIDDIGELLDIIERSERDL